MHEPREAVRPAVSSRRTVNLQLSRAVDHLMVGMACAVAPETQTEAGVADANVAEGELREPFGQARVDNKRLAGRDRNEAEHRLDQQHDRAG